MKRFKILAALAAASVAAVMMCTVLTGCDDAEDGWQPGESDRAKDTNIEAEADNNEAFTKMRGYYAL